MAVAGEQHEQQRRRHGLELGAAPAAALLQRRRRRHGRPACGRRTARPAAAEPGDEPGEAGVADGAARRRRVRVRVVVAAAGAQRANHAQVLVKLFNYLLLIINCLKPNLQSRLLAMPMNSMSDELTLSLPSFFVCLFLPFPR